MKTRSTKMSSMGCDLYQEWSQVEIDGRLVEPSDTSYGLREGACLDRDANLIRFGSGI